MIYDRPGELLLQLEKMGVSLAGLDFFVPDLTHEAFYMWELSQSTQNKMFFERGYGAEVYGGQVQPAYISKVRGLLLKCRTPTGQEHVYEWTGALWENQDPRFRAIVTCARCGHVYNSRTTEHDEILCIAAKIHLS